MSKTVTIVDYGIGNIFSVTRALEHAGAIPVLSGDPEEILRADRLVLPGVGAFADGMQGLRQRNLVEPICRYAASGKPLLGICLGMQMLASVSEEFGEHEGLGIVPGRVVSLSNKTPDGASLKIPHIGWSPLRHDEDARSWSNTLLADLPSQPSVYSVHSFHLFPEDKRDRLAHYFYGGNVVNAAVRRGNVTGFQFHPEKSGKVGLQMFANFLSLF